MMRERCVHGMIQVHAEKETSMEAIKIGGNCKHPGKR